MQRFEKSSYHTLEAFVSAIARYCIVDLQYQGATVSAYKPSVFAAAEGPGVEIYRTAEMLSDGFDHHMETEDSLEGIR